jgi:methionyl aminopeptidase
MAIQIKNLEQLKLMRKAGLVVAHTLNLIRDSAEIGMTTVDLDLLAVRSLEKYNAKSSFKGYHGFPAVICASVNEEVVHGIPNKRVIQDGDILSVDFGAIVDGWHGDSAITIEIGTKIPAQSKLSSVTKAAMWAGVGKAVAGNHLSDISHAVEKIIRTSGDYGILEDYTGNFCRKYHIYQ